MMRVLSLSRPWTWAIFDKVANKGVENRSWPPPIEAIGERIAIQAAKSWDKDAIPFFLKLGLSGFPNRKENYVSGAIIGVVTLDRVVTSARSLAPEQARWFFGEYGWVIIDRILLPTPIAMPGTLGLRWLAEDHERLVNEQLAQKAREQHG